MAGGIVANKRESTGREADTECNAVIWPYIGIHRGSEDEVGRILWSKVHKRDKDRKESNNVPDESTTCQLLYTSG